MVNVNPHHGTVTLKLKVKSSSTKTMENDNVPVYCIIAWFLFLIKSTRLSRQHVCIVTYPLPVPSVDKASSLTDRDKNTAAKPWSEPLPLLLKSQRVHTSKFIPHYLPQICSFYFSLQKTSQYWANCFISLETTWLIMLIKYNRLQETYWKSFISI